MPSMQTDPYNFDYLKFYYSKSDAVLNLVYVRYLDAELSKLLVNGAIAPK